MHTLTLTADRRLFVLVMKGTVAVNEGRQAFLSILDHPGFEPMIPILVDIREIEEIVADFKGVFMAVQVLKSRMASLNRKSLFLVLAGDGASFGMARMLQQVVEVITELRMKVVATPAEACARLGCSETVLEGLVAGSCKKMPDGPLV